MRAEGFAQMLLVIFGTVKCIATAKHSIVAEYGDFRVGRCESSSSQIKRYRWLSLGNERT
jgi:hypothetical protein